MSQGASNGPGQGAGKSFVSFSRPAAQRIAKAVRVIEAGDRNQPGLTFDHPMPGGGVPKQVRAATFTGSWAIGASKVVTFAYAPTATQTVTNLSWPITHNHSVAENCIVGREGTSWWLVVPVLQTVTAVFVTATASGSRVTDVSISASLNTTNCSISVGKTLTTTSMTLISTTATATYLRLRVP
jgi:hypothetical protein